jgi:hypothetical protein
MARREYVPPTVCGPTPADPDELEREGNELVAEIQKAADAQQKPDSAVIGIVLSVNDARRRRDEAEEARLEQQVIERWTGSSVDEGAKNGKL